ncbi:MAG TPA: hypothetical protein VNY73_07020 [Bacteroidia bacterium]|nr:hypothetical protein [Bacteroidia bacterium]
MEKKQKKKKPPDKDFTKAISENLSSVNKGWVDMPPYVKGVIIAGTAIAILWASGYAFSAIAGAISGFKRLRRSIRET